MTKEDIVDEYINMIKKEEMPQELENYIKDFRIDDIDLYNLNPESKILFIITGGDPITTFKIALSNIYQNKKIVLFINHKNIKVNNLLVNKFTNLKIEYDFKGELFLETHESYEKYISIRNKFSEIILIGQEEKYKELLNDFNNLTYIDA